MFTLALLVLLFLVLVALIVVAGLGYLVHRHPALFVPLQVAMAAATVLVTLVIGVVQAAAFGSEPTSTTAPARQDR